MRISADDGGADGNGGVGSNEDGADEDGGGDANEDGGYSGDGGGAEFSKGTAWSGVEFSRGLKVGSFYSLSRAELTTWAVEWVLEQQEAQLSFRPTAQCTACTAQCIQSAKRDVIGQLLAGGQHQV